MNKSNVLFLAGLMLCLMACGDDDLLPDGYNGYGSALKNGKQWEFVTWTLYGHQCDCTDTVGIQIAVFEDPRGAPSEMLFFGSIPFEVGQCTPSVAIHRTRIPCETDYGTLEDDLLTSSYDLDARAANNYFEVTEVDYDRKELRGKFQVTMIRDFFSPQPGLIPDTIRFTNGEFFARLSE